jgi:hypothetical protein
VPGFIGRRVGPTVERFILSVATPSLRGVAGGLARYLGERAPAHEARRGDVQQGPGSFDEARER